MIGYYVHHQGSGHRHRAASVRACLEQIGVDVIGLSTATRPAVWTGDWADLPDDAGNGPERDVSAHDRLHYVPLGSSGLSARMARISRWLDAMRPAALVVDVSVEVALLARLHGVPVVVVAQPGRRGDPAHRLGYDIASRIVAPWPAAFGGLWEAAPEDLDKTSFVGAIGRFAPLDVGPLDVAPLDVGRSGPRRVLVVNGTGGDGAEPADVARAREATPDWDWIQLDRRHGSWVDDPWPLICSADVVVSHAGQNLIAEIAAARKPAVVLPQERPFDEQRQMAAALVGGGLPVRVRDGWPRATDWPGLLDDVVGLDGAGWSAWNDGGGAARMAAVLAGFEADRAVGAPIAGVDSEAVPAGLTEADPAGLTEADPAGLTEAVPA